MFGKQAIAISEQTRSEPEGETTNNTENKTAKQKGIEAALVVYGRDDKGKAHASSFGEADRGAAIKAAYLMGFNALAVTQTVIKNIAEDLPSGRLFESGKAFVPFVKEGVCAALFAHAKQFPRDVRELSQKQIDALEAVKASEAEVTATIDKGKDSAKSKAKDDATKKPPKPLLASDWQDVEEGSIVLAVDEPDDGWWEARVTNAHKSGIGKNIITMLTLEWVAFPEEASFIRRSNEVAYFPTGFGQTEPVDAQTNQSGGASS